MTPPSTLLPTATRLKVLVAMSGGVDSSYVAAAMAKEGHDIVGVTLKVWQDKDKAFAKGEDCSLELVEPGGTKKTCCGAEDMKDARSVARSMGFPYYILDYEDRFQIGRAHV